jgi:uncharacterized protein (TIGR00725 family)
MLVSVFGGSQALSGSQEYQEAYELGRRLAKAEHTVLTGGYIGTMEAVSKGAREAGGHVIGVTCDEIEAWRPVKPNPWVVEERRFATLPERLNELIKACDAAVALPGGPGTLTEIAFCWNLMIIQAIPAKPLILVGPAWKSVIETIYQELGSYISGRQRGLVSFIPDVQSVII